MNSKKIFTLLVLVVGFMTLSSCKGQAKNAAGETESSQETTANTPVHMYNHPR